MEPPPDPDLKGEFGSNKTAMELRSPNPGDAGEPWSHYLNPAHPGVAAYLGVTAPTGGLGAQSFGETRIDEYRLRPIPGKAPRSAYDSGWSTKIWLVNGYSYERRRVTLKSGASLVIFAPTNPPDLEVQYGCGLNAYYDRDAFYVPRGYQGNRGFEIDKRPPAWVAGHVDPYDGDPEFGYEIEIPGVNDFDLSLDDVTWIRVGSIEHEALERGMTLVFVHASLGSRPILTHLSQLIEAAKWMGGCEFAGSCQQFPTPSTYRFRNFIGKGSYNGAVARVATTYMPWLFRGGISIAGGVDMHSTFAWEQAYTLLQKQVLGIYPGGFLDPYDQWDADVQSLFGDLERGYAGPDAYPIGVQNPDPMDPGKAAVDVAGMGLFAWDLGDFSNDELVVPLVLVHGDEDQGQYGFYGKNLETELQLGDSSNWSPSLTGVPCIGGTAVPYTGVVVERRAPNLCHDGIERWNQEQHLLMPRRGLLDILMEEVAKQPMAPIPFSASNPSGEMEWTIRATGDQPRLARTFRDELSRPKVTELEEAVFGNVSCTDVTQVTGGDWKELGEVCEGLGMPDSVVLADLGGDADLELVAGTARGDVVKLVLETNGSGYVQSVDLLWRARVSDYFSASEAVDYFGPSEVHREGASEIVVAHAFGPIWKIDASSDTLPDPTDVQLVRGNLPEGGHAYDAGAFLRGLQKSGGMYSLVNDEGELIEFDTAGTFNRYFLEGGAGPVVPLSGGGYLYGSAHGNVMQTDTTPPAHPTSDTDISEHLYGIPRILLHLETAVGSGDILAWTDHLILLDEDDLSVVGKCRERSPDGLREADPGSFVGFWKRIPGVLAFQANDPLQLDIPVVAAFQVDASGMITFGDYVRLPAPVTALVPYPSPGISTAVPTFLVKWLATLQTGQVALIGDLSTGTGDVTATELAVFREPYGNTFGMATLDQPSALVVAAGPESKGWMLDVDEDVNVIAGPPQPNLFHPGKTTTWAPYRGAVVVGSDLYGLPDGGEAYQDGALVAMPFSSPYLQSDAAASPQTLDPLDVEAGVMVVDVTLTATEPNNSFMEYEGIQDALWCSTYIEAGLCKTQVATSVVWKSDVLTSHPTVGSVEDTGFILKGFGNACRWADLDGNGTQDLVGGTHGGRILWFRNSTSGSPPLLPTQPTGEYAYPDPNAPGDPVPLGWDGDLGTTMMAMEVANLDADGADEVLVGTFFDVDPAHNEHYRLGGSVQAFGRDGSDALVRLDGIDLDFGVCGLALIPYAVFPPPPMTGGARRYVAAGTARGRVYVLEYDPNRPSGSRFSLLYRSRFYAPMAGAYNAIRSFSIGDPANRQFRVVFGSSGGIFAFDIVMPADFTPGPEVTCTPP